MRRTFSNVNWSAITARQPSVPKRGRLGLVGATLGADFLAMRAFLCAAMLEKLYAKVRRGRTGGSRHFARDVHPNLFDNLWHRPIAT